MTIDQWNLIPKDEETDVEAKEGDLCTLIDGVAFLVQRKNEWNNVVCIRLQPSRRSIVQTFNDFRIWCKNNEIQFFRVEGISHTYKMLKLVERLGQQTCKDCKAVYAKTESEQYKRHIYYIKAY